MFTLLLVAALSGTVHSAAQSQYSLFTRVHPVHPTQVPHLQHAPEASYHPEQLQRHHEAPLPIAVAAYTRRDAQAKEFVPILAYSNDIAFDGTYSYNYETGDGMTRQESGVMNNRGTPDEAPSVTGSYSYTDPEGRLIKVNYVADANGFRAEGDHLPTPPPIPVAILRSLEYIAAKQRSEPIDRNSYNERIVTSK
uniref:Cuticular protein n=1 Tax=Nilaparvata lugens TaxID=108931 RepID=V5V0J9_NILLU|nr:cuticular protein [Nilaparvata lugens]